MNGMPVQVTHKLSLALRSFLIFLLVLHTAPASAKSHQERIEHLYLQEFGAHIFAAATRLGSISAQVSPDMQLDSLSSASPRCAKVREKFQQWQGLAYTKHPPLPSAYLFQHYLMTSLLLWHINRNLYQLSEELYAHKTLATDAVEQDKQDREQALKEKIKLLNTHMRKLLTAESMPLIAKHGKYSFFQKIAHDYYELTIDAQLTGTELLRHLQDRNLPILDAIVERLMTRLRQYLHHAWRHSCADLSAASNKRLAFYLKHPQLVTHVQSLLSKQEKDAHTEIQQSLADHLSSKRFRSSAMSFFSIVGGLTLPAYLVPRRYNKYTLSTMALAGSALTYLKTKVLVDTRKQLEIGVFAGLNDFEHYHNFYLNTSVSKYAFAHLAATSLAIVLRSMPRPKGELFYSDTAFLARMNFFGSMMTMYGAEALQKRKFDLWRDKNFRHNMFIVLTVDTTLALLSSMSLPNEVRISVAAAVTILASITAHIFAGKEINWDRIVYDTTYVSTYSLYKSIFLYTNGSRLLIKKMGLNSKTSHTAVMVGMSVLSNVAGNLPYSFLARQWIEKMDEHNNFPLQTNLNTLGDSDLGQALQAVITKHGYDTTEVAKVIEVLYP